MSSIFLQRSVLNEAFYGSINADKLAVAIHEARRKYLDVNQKHIKKNFYGDKKLSRVGHVIRELFGFNVVDFNLCNDPSHNAFTFPIGRSITSVIAQNIDTDSLKKDSNGPKFDVTANKGLNIYIRVTTGLWCNKNYTDQEVTAIILHEIGHNFEQVSNSILSKLDILESVAIIVSNPGNLVFDPNVRAIANNFAKTNKTLTKLIEAFSGISGIIKYALFSIYQLAELFSFGAVKLALHAIQIPMGIFSSVSRGREFNADAFVSSLGYAEHMSSALLKMETASDRTTGTKIEKAIQKIPILGSYKDFIFVLCSIIMAPFSFHPVTGRRINQMIQNMEKDLTNSDMSPEMKKELQNHISYTKEVSKIYVQPKKGDHINLTRRWLKKTIEKGKGAGPIATHFGTQDVLEQNIYESAIIDISESLMELVDGLCVFFENYIEETENGVATASTDVFDNICMKYGLIQ